MKKKIFSIVLLFAFLIPCLTLLTGCGKIKEISGKTLVFAKVEVEGSVSKEEYENLYKGHSFEFTEEKVTFTDGVNKDTYDYKFEKSKIYIKDTNDAEFEKEPYAEISGEYMVVSQTVEGGVVKAYFKVK
jgi:major membrane immunogen (membrane-anchored lipoprotein)